MFLDGVIVALVFQVLQRTEAGKKTSATLSGLPIDARESGLWYSSEFQSRQLRRPVAQQNLYGCFLHDKRRQCLSRELLCTPLFHIEPVRQAGLFVCVYNQDN